MADVGQLRQRQEAAAKSMGLAAAPASSNQVRAPRCGFWRVKICEFGGLL
jgi:hypothetical protein